MCDVVMSCWRCAPFWRHCFKMVPSPSNIRHYPCMLKWLQDFGTVSSCSNKLIVWNMSLSWHNFQLAYILLPTFIMNSVTANIPVEFYHSLSCINNVVLFFLHKKTKRRKTGRHITTGSACSSVTFGRKSILPENSLSTKL